MKKLKTVLGWIYLTGNFILLGYIYYLCLIEPDPVFIKGFIPAESAPTMVYQEMNGKIQSVTTLPVIIENGKRGLQYTGYVVYSLNGFSRPSPKAELTEHKIPGKKVYVLVEQTENGLAIRKSSLEPI